METIWFITGIFLLVLVAAFGVHRLNNPSGRQPPDNRPDARTQPQRQHMLSRRERAYVDWFTRQDA